MTDAAVVEARREIAAVVYRELGDMVNRNYLIDGLMPVLETVIAAAEARGAQAVLAAVEALVSSWEAGNESYGAGDREWNRTAALRALVDDARAAAAVPTSSAKSSDLATRVPQDESQRAAGGDAS